MDIILQDHSIENLEKTFDAIFLFDHPLYSLLAKSTEMKWLVIIPKQELTGAENNHYVQNLYGEIYRLADFVQEEGFGGHYNLAKIGNKHPNYHIHLVFRDEQDEAWPDAIWCHEPLKPSKANIEAWQKIISQFSN